MSKQTRLKENQQKRIPAPKLRREPLPMSISVKHHLPISADGTATDLTVAELEKTSDPISNSQLDYSTSQVKPTTNTTTNIVSGLASNTVTSEKQSVSKKQSSYPSFTEEKQNRKKSISKLDQILDLSFSFDQVDQADHDQVDQADHNDQVDRDQASLFDHNYPLFSEQQKYLPQDNRLQQNTKKKAAERTIENLDLNIQSRFVRVPNWVADQLARQLSPAEEKIFDQIWRLTIGFNREIWRGKISDLMIRTGYSSRATVTKALAGLLALGLVRIEGRDTNPRGRSYRIVDRVKTSQTSEQTFNSTKNLDQKFDQRLDQRLDQTLKNDHAKLVKQATSQARASNSTKKSMTTHANSNQLVEHEVKSKYSQAIENKQVRPLEQSTSQVFKNTFRKTEEDDSGNLPSSSQTNDRNDDENFFQVRLIYQDLSQNHWIAKDTISYQEIAQIPIPYIILGICYSISRASDHKISSLKYCIPSICEHYELMRTFPQKDLLEIAYRHLVLVKEAQRGGKWF
ncbi:MAG: hypothetical protein HY819_08795 [Acidobacteria bacterium]|nr:hypothetical protein [Acidobacteriota bacterium]